MKTIKELEAKLSDPSEQLVNEIVQLEGDIMILGVGGKMGPSLAQLAKNAVDKAGVNKKVIGVSRFTSSEARLQLEESGIETISADLLNEEQLQALPDVKNIIYMVGKKFGTAGNESFTWAMNAYLPGRIAQKFQNSRIVVFSSGNVYPLTPLTLGGATEQNPTGPIGEYAQSCVGRERVFEHFSKKYKTPMVKIRLNYAIDLRYGVLLEVAKSVNEQKPIDLTMGHANVIWQGDANEIAIRSLSVCDTPPKTLNVTGPETVSLRWLAERMGEYLEEKPIFINEEQDIALLNNASQSNKLFGYPSVSLQEMIEWTVEWVKIDGETLGKPTHFQEREGAF
ncbi:NAD-dependent epimerase/dehydratase family protein [Alteribacter populi]|uniref:NAD-dependent epimerase/dehydratase family protein n=1 Tax=Alteribacter populi TaxID=2011011 RepID=UPI000BBA8560|nr:NAD-dependent epimerase/dehydratase family protein [Alteribacter populi]